MVWAPKQSHQPHSQMDQSVISARDLVECLKNEEDIAGLPEQMARFGCDFQQSRALIQAGAYDEALGLLEEATGEPLQIRASGP